jgi:biuret amidohydrolase
MVVVRAEPYEFEFDPATVALVIIDMQRDFVYPGGFGEALGNNTALLLDAVAPTRKVLEAARKAGIYIIHTREGHRPDLADLWAAKKQRGRLKTTIGDVGPMGRILVRGERGHDIIDELKPQSGEPVIDKPGKGAFYATDFNEVLRSRGIRQLIVCGVTTEVCVTTTVREANDRGYDCLVLEDCVASYFPEFQDFALRMIKAQGGIFGWVSKSANLLPVLAKIKAKKGAARKPGRLRAA